MAQYANHSFTKDSLIYISLQLEGAFLGVGIKQDFVFSLTLYNVGIGKRRDLVLSLTLYNTGVGKKRDLFFSLTLGILGISLIPKLTAEP